MFGIVKMVIMAQRGKIGKTGTSEKQTLNSLKLNTSYFFIFILSNFLKLEGSFCLLTSGSVRQIHTIKLYHNPILEVIKIKEKIIFVSKDTCSTHNRSWDHLLSHGDFFLFLLVPLNSFGTLYSRFFKHASAYY